MIRYSYIPVFKYSNVQIFKPSVLASALFHDARTEFFK